jgi:hypothetical protein
LAVGRCRARSRRNRLKFGEATTPRAHRARQARYNRFMVIVTFLMRVLELMFFLGLAGSSVVVLISFYEDGKELFGKD